MIIKTLSLSNFRGFKSARFDFEGFECLTGPNGIGKTSVLDAISLLCSSLDFKDDEGIIENDDHWIPRVSGQQRMEAFLKRNVLSFGRADDPKGFLAEAVFEHDGHDLLVRLTEKGYQHNDLLRQDWWWPGIVCYSKFDTEMTRFQLQYSLWPSFKRHFEGITGFPVEPEVYTETELAGLGLESELVVGFWMEKGPRGKIHCRMASAGEKKIAKALSQIVNLDRRPHIALVDNLEMHVHYKRHIRMFEEVKKLFSGIQIIATTHSTVLMQEYDKNDLIDVEEILNGSTEAAG